MSHSRGEPFPNVISIPRSHSGGDDDGGGEVLLWSQKDVIMEWGEGVTEQVHDEKEEWVGQAKNATRDTKTTMSTTGTILILFFWLLLLLLLIHSNTNWHRFISSLFLGFSCCSP